MDIGDFAGLTKYKLVIPFIYVVSWICMIIGPSFFPVVYQKISIGILIYLGFKVFWIFLTMLIILIKSWSLISKAQDSGR